MEQSVYEIVVRPVMRILTDHISKHLGYAACSTKHVNNMRKKMKVLEDTSADVKKHMETNKTNFEEIPTGVSDWLNDVENLKERVKSISSDNIGCLNIKRRYQAGRKACKNTSMIEELITKEFKWTNAPIPSGIVASKPTSSATTPPSSSGGEVFRSRDKPFNDALKLLQLDIDNSPVIALCGMGGVGKTTMMEQLERVAKENTMFDMSVKVVFGRSYNMLSIQNDVSVQMGGKGLREKTEAASAESLCKKFKEMLQDGKKRILVILDDMWQNINLKNIGITSPLPKGLKLLLTSRDSKICSQIAVGAGLTIQVIKVDVLEKAEAQNLFCQIAGVSKENDEDKYLIGCDIVKACGHLPLAIKLIASTLKFEEMFEWRTTRDRLKNREVDDDVQEIVKISYDCIKKDEEKKIFLHCGLFPEDHDIPIEDLMRHAWGLKLFKKVSTLREARDRTNTCVGNLIKANLLINSDKVGCVKLHDLVLAFVLSEVSKGDHGWIINHGDVSKWDRDEVGESCKRISLTCKGMSEFPSKYRYPNMYLLQLMDGDLSLIFPEDFYDKMENLKVIAYYNMQYPLLPRSLEYSANLKSLFLHECKLVFDMSSIGDLVNLEVLSFAGSGIYRLPSMIGNLRKLKLLDLTGCVNLHIDDGVFKRLKSLEELYMRVSGRQAVRFTDTIFEELMMLSSQLCALEVEFVNKITRLKNVWFTKLDRFRISVGHLFASKLENENYPFKNTLNLVTNHSSDLLDCKISELFKKTEKLTLEVKYMLRLEDIVSLHPLDRSTFSCLSDLEVSNCEKMKYLFTISVATGLRKLENLKISSCDNLEALIHDYGSEINSGCEMIKFEELKCMSLKNLPKLVSLFLVENVVIELPQLIKLEVEELPNFTSIYPNKNNISALLNNQVKIPELKELKIRSMSNLEQIWACSNDEEVNGISMLRVIEVEECSSLVSLFPTNPIRLVNQLEELKVSKCGSIEVIFNIDLESCVSEVERLSNNSLKSIEVSDSENLREVWRIKCDENKSSCILSFDAIEKISVRKCERFRKIFTSTNIKFDMHALRNLHIEKCGKHEKNMELVEYRQHEEAKVLSAEERDDKISTVAIPSSLVHNFLNLDTLELDHHDGMEVVFEIESGLLSSTDLVTTTTHNQQPPLLLPYLQTLYLEKMKSMSHVWKCSNWNKFLILQKQLTQSSFQSLTSIYLSDCKRIKYLFSPLMAKLLSNLKTIDIQFCDSMEEIISNRDDKDEETTATYETTTLFPHLHSLVLDHMDNLKRIGGDAGVRDEIKFSQVNIDSWSLCQYPREIGIYSCSELVEIFETQGITNNGGGFGSHTDIDETGRGGTDTTTLAIPRLENIHVPQLSNLKKLVIEDCHLLQHVFTFSTLESLKQLEKLTIKYCSAMEVVVKKENEEQRKDVVFPHLKSIQLVSLPNLKGFFLGMNRFEWPLLETVVIEECPQMEVFTSGVSIAPKLTHIHTELGKNILDEGGLNFDLTRESQQMQVPSAESTSISSLFLKRFPLWYNCNLIEILMEFRWDNISLKSLISSNDVPHLQKLERILVFDCKFPKVVFEEEAKEGANSESQTILEIPNLTQLELKHVALLKYIWKRNHHHNNNRTVWLFPNLTTMIIERCGSLNYVISSSMVGSLQQLQHLHVKWCSNMKEVVKVEEEENIESDAKGKEIVLPCLKSLKLQKLDRLEGFYLGTEDISLPSLHTLEITKCSKIKVFSRGHVATPALRFFDTSLGRCYVRKDINSSMEAIVNIQEEEEEEEEKKKKEKKKEREDEEDEEEEDEEDDEEEDENDNNEDRDDEEEEVHSYIETAQHESASNN